MDSADKVLIFKEEIDSIKDTGIRSIVIKTLENAPDYFFEIPASSTGKYHPSFSLGKGGVVRHTKMAVRIANDLFNIFDLGEEGQDIARGALIVHDLRKSGKEQDSYTKHEHPLLACELIDEANPDTVGSRIQETMKKCIASHMGKWTTSNRSSVVLPVPETNLEKFIHLCDYIASRRFFDMYR